jgi:hypothetical protein
MAKIPGTNVIAPVVPFDTADVHPSHDARYGKGGYRTVATLAERDSIPAPRREAGMLVFVEADEKTYQLDGDLATWSEFKSGASTWEELAGKPSEFPAEPHTHAIADVTGLQSSLDSKQASGSYAAAVHSHGIADVTGLQAALDNKQAAGSYAATVHGHAIGDVAGLQAALDSKQPGGSYALASHTHAASDITDFAAAVVAAAPPTTNASLLTSGTLDAARLPGSVVLTTDSRLSDARQPVAHQHVAADITDFTSAVIAAAPPTVNASLLTSGTLPDARLSANIARTSDVTAAVAAVVDAAPASLDTLNELAAALGDDANFASTVTNALAAKAPIASPTFTGEVGGITKGMVGLANVDNTSDADKPISTATQAALGGKANSTHTHSGSDITSGTISNARLPVATATSLGVVRLGIGSSSGLFISGGELSVDSSQFVSSGDARLTNSRTPTAHAASHSVSGADPLSLDTTQISIGFDITLGGVSYATLRNWLLGCDTQLSGKAAASHAHGNITNAGAIGSTSGQIVVTGASGVLTTAATISAGSVSGLATVATSGSYADLTGKPTLFDGSYTSLTNVPSTFAPAAHTQAWSTITATPTTLAGYGITDAVVSSDSRLTDARTPTAHKSSHATGGTDALTPADIGAAAASHTHTASDITSGALSNDRLTSRARAAVNVFNWSSFR